MKGADNRFRMKSLELRRYHGRTFCLLYIHVHTRTRQKVDWFQMTLEEIAAIYDQGSPG